MSLQKLSETLVRTAFMDGYMIGSPTEFLVRRAVRDNKWDSLPNRCKPGGLIKSLSDGDREKVKRLTAKHFNHRQD